MTGIHDSTGFRPGSADFADGGQCDDRVRPVECRRGPIGRPAGWCEASTRAVLLLDGDGDVLSSRCFGRLPEQGKSGPDRSIVDARHASQHVKECADDALGKNTADGGKWFGKYRTIQLGDAKCIGRTIDAIRHLINSGRGARTLVRKLECFRRNLARMDHSCAGDAGCPIGSGCVDSDNRIMDRQQVQRSGQRWGQEGGQAVLTFRSLLKSGRFDDACRSMVRRRTANGPFKFPASVPDSQQEIRRTSQDAMRDSHPRTPQPLFFPTDVC